MTVGHRTLGGSALRLIALLGALALFMALAPGAALATHTEETDQLEAETAVDAALSWSQYTFDAATDAALGRDDVFADNLASSVIQGTMDAPLLLTDSDELHPEVLAELERLGVTDVHVLGGDNAISDEVVDELEANGFDTHRDAGETRIETAIDIAATHAADATEGLLVRAFGTAGGDETQAWADALAAGGWAAEEGMPVFLTQSAELNDNLRAYLEGSDITKITVIGGSAAISEAVVDELEAMGIEVERVSGGNRFETAVRVANARGFETSNDAETVILSEGQQANAWAGGFAAAAFSAQANAPIVLSNGENIPPETADFLEAGEPADGATPNTHGTPHLVCGPLVEDEACAAAAEELGKEPATHEPDTNQDFDATPNEAAVNTVSDNSAQTTQNRGQRQYTFSGLDNTKQYDIGLIPSEEVSTTDGTTTFRDNNVGLANQADNLCNTTAFIEVVNGASTAGTDDCVNNVSPVNGAITITIDSTTGESVVPVIWQDADNDNQLDLVVPASANNNPKEPSEDFATGGRKTWTPTEAQSGRINADQNVDSVDKDLNYIVAGGVRYNYDENDTFQIATASAARGVNEASTCTNTTMANFEQQLSQNDELDQATNYTRETGAASTFCLEDVAPGAPTITQAQAQDQDTNRLTWTAPATGTPDSYNIYRLQTANACPEGQTNLNQYSQVANVPGTTTTYDDNGLAANTRYCYVVTAVQNGDESAPSGSANATTTEAGTTVQPQSTDAYIQTDTTFPGVISGGDQWRVIFDKQMQPVTANDTIVLRDAQGDTLNVVCDETAAPVAGGQNALCEFNASNVTVAGTQYGPGRVLTVTIDPDAADADANDPESTGIIPATSTPTGGNGQVEYPATITTQNGFVDVNNNPWTPTDDPDNVIDNEGSKTFVTATDPNATNTAGGGAAPEFTGVANLTATTVDVNYDENVVPYGGAYAPNQFCYSQLDNANGTCTDANEFPATAVTQVDGDTLRLTFAAGNLPATLGAQAADEIVYLDPVAFQDTGDVVDTVGNQQPHNDDIPVA